MVGRGGKSVILVPMPAKKLGAVVLTAVVVAGSALAVKNISFVDPRETVYKIADGDTFILEQNKQTVRLFGIDAPEKDNCYGPESYSRLGKLLKKGKVQLKEPVVDKFGRIVALVYVDGKFINEIMIREGFAAYRSEPGSGKEAMKAAHEYAKTQKLGIYSSACTDDTPPDPKCPIKGNHDLDRDEFLYLTPDCPYYSLVTIRRFEGDRWFCTGKEAESAGFKVSSACALGTKRNPKSITP
ncbi:MAG: Thermonuclease family protein [Candidatus Amesbacteria bacterium GW2011_GWA2_47_11]|uniref:Thermonuclease family protein n=5 Tax=Candidatus Amesiibacteriota TaxID=1752730 RepID=A0A0G1XJP4_9BACT|nr:MAG: Thermonuclease family protein [Candidatus Amesbacteria bacterium GW2011_GWA2_47_11]KKU94580.1 MAG: Thermonuclease family protein [Candidatus Amesbacteria bacterium GW2011_GWC1_48_10]